MKDRVNNFIDRSCYRKKKYKNERNDLYAAEKYNLEYYFCQICGYWRERLFRREIDMKKLFLTIIILVSSINIIYANNFNDKIDPIEEHIELTDEDVEFCYNHSIFDILIKYKDGAGIFAFEPKLAYKLTLANDYNLYKDNVNLNNLIRNYQKRLDEIIMLEVDINNKIIDSDVTKISTISLIIDDVVDRHQKYIELYRYPELYKNNNIKAKGNVYKNQDKYYLNLNYDGDIPEAFDIQFITIDNKYPKEQDIIQIIGQLNYNENGKIYLNNCKIVEKNNNNIS